jgi:hypothetical protein
VVGLVEPRVRDAALRLIVHRYTQAATTWGQTRQDDDLTEPVTDGAVASAWVRPAAAPLAGEPLGRRAPRARGRRRATTPLSAQSIDIHLVSVRLYVVARLACVL